MSRDFLAFPRARIPRAHDALVAGARRSPRCSCSRLRASRAGARPVRGRRQSRGRELLRHRCRAHAVHRVHDLRRDRRRRAAICGWRASRWRTPTSRSASSCGHRRLPDRRRGDCRRHRLGDRRGARLPVHRHHSQQPAAGRHFGVLADVHQWRGHPGRRAAERAAARVSSAPFSRRAHEGRRPAALGDRCWPSVLVLEFVLFSAHLAVFPRASTRSRMRPSISPSARSSRCRWRC